MVWLRYFIFAFASFAALAVTTPSQNRKKVEPAQKDNEVICVTRTELVTADFPVRDHGGRNVSGLTRDMFSLTVDGRRTSISYFSVLDNPNGRIYTIGYAPAYPCCASIHTGFSIRPVVRLAVNVNSPAGVIKIKLGRVAQVNYGKTM